MNSPDQITLKAFMVALHEVPGQFPRQLQAQLNQLGREIALNLKTIDH